MVRQIPLPISLLVIEDVQVDVARLNNPELKGSEYQDPTRLDEKTAHRLPDAGRLSVPAVWKTALSPAIPSCHVSGTWWKGYAGELVDVV